MILTCSCDRDVFTPHVYMIVMNFLIFMPKSRLSLSYNSLIYKYYFKLVYNIIYDEILSDLFCPKDWTKIGNAINLQTC